MPSRPATSPEASKPDDVESMTGPRSPLFTSVRYADQRRWPRVAKIAGVGVASVLVLLLAAGLGLWRYASSRLDREALSAIDSQDHQGTTDPDTGAPVEGTLNVLVVGLDTRQGLTEQQLLELGTEDVGSALTDTIMVVQITPAREQVAVLSFPRDLKVTPPGHGPMKINAVHPTGGADLLVRTVEDYISLDLDHYVAVNLAGFIELTDALDGVEICLDEAKVDRFAGVDLPAGCQVLSGAEAAGFVRSRLDADQFGEANDFGRIARQQYFIRQAMREVTSARTLLNPLRVKSLIDVVADNLTTDRDLGASEMLRLANSLKGLRAEDLDTRVVPGYYSAETGYVHAYPDEAEAVFQSFRNATDLPDVGTSDPRANELAATDVAVAVLNGEGTSGLAAEVAAFLESHGFVVAETGNAESFDVERTRIEYVAGSEAHARKLAEQLPGAEQAEVGGAPGGADVALIIGADWGEIAPAGATAAPDPPDPSPDAGQ